LRLELYVHQPVSYTGWHACGKPKISQRVLLGSL